MRSNVRMREYNNIGESNNNNLSNPHINYAVE